MHWSLFFCILVVPGDVIGLTSRRISAHHAAVHTGAGFVGSPISLQQMRRTVLATSSHATFASPNTKRQSARLYMSTEVVDSEKATQDSNSAGLGCWIPVASVTGLQDLNPHMVKIMNRNYVVWKHPETARWTVQVDACTHRLAPLSQGRINEKTGCVECPYHGWQFNSKGECTNIPQADVSSIPADKLAVHTLPTHVTGDLVWAFFPTSQTGESFPVDLLPEQMYPVLQVSKEAETSFFVRELPYSWDFLIENFMDPAHIPFAHHSLQGVRSDGSPIAMSVVASNFTHCEVSFQDVVRGKPRVGIGSIQRPVYYHFRTTEADGQYKERLKIFTVPVTHGRCRVFFEAPSLKLFPLWLTHAAANRFLSTDTWLHHAERMLREPDMGRRYFNPCSSDMGPVEFRKWWNRHGMARAPPHSFGPAPFADLPEQTRAQQVDVWDTHTKHCSTCRRAARAFKLAQRAGLVGAVLAAVLLSSSKLLAVAAAAAGLAVSALAGKCRRIVEGEALPSGIPDRSVAATAPSKE